MGCHTAGITHSASTVYFMTLAKDNTPFSALPQIMSVHGHMLMTPHQPPVAVSHPEGWEGGGWNGVGKRSKEAKTATRREVN